MKFTDRYLQSLKPKEKDYRVREGHGFAVRVLPSGVKRFEYIYTINGKRRILHLGNYPATKLADARQAFHNATTLTNKRLDPQEKPAPPPPSPEELSVQKLAELWIKEWSKVHHSDKWHNTLKLALEKDLLSLYGERLATEIRRRDAIQILEVIAKRAPGQAVNFHKAARGMYAYAVEREILDYNPFADIKAAKTIPSMKQQSRKRTLADDEIKHVWSAIDTGGGSDCTKLVLKLILVTGQRPGEVCGMHRSEINDNWWTIPPERSLKNDEEQRVFLSPLALTLIGAKRGYICPGEPDMPISENSVAHHVRRKVSNTGKISYYGLPRWTPHDLRRTFGTGVIRLGATREIMEAILGHTIPGVAGVYNRHKYDPEKKKWSLKWSTWLEKILNITTTGTEKKSAVNKSKAEVARKRQRKSPKGSGLARTASPKKQ